MTKKKKMDNRTVLKKYRGQILHFRKTRWRPYSRRAGALFCSCKDCFLCTPDLQDLNCVLRCGCLYCRAIDREHDRGVELYTEFGLNFDSTLYVRADTIIRAIDIYRRLLDIEYWPCRLENIAAQNIVNLAQGRLEGLKPHLDQALFLRLKSGVHAHNSEVTWRSKSLVLVLLQHITQQIQWEMFR